MQQVFQGRVLAQQWRKPKRDVKPGDVVMLAEAEVEDPVYHLGKVDSVKTGEDGHVRTVSIQYTNPGRNPQERSPMKVTTRPIHKIAVIVPVDYRFEDDQGSLATEQGKATREASPPPETARIQELPRSISWADEMEEEYELNGPPVVLCSHNSLCKKMYNKGAPPSAWAGLLNKPFLHFWKKRAFYFQF